MNNINNLDQFNKHIKRVIISKEEIEAKIQEVGKQISDTYDGRPILICLLN